MRFKLYPHLMLSNPGLMKEAAPLPMLHLTTKLPVKTPAQAERMREFLHTLVKLKEIEEEQWPTSQSS